MNRNECIFCRIVAGELPAASIYEDNDIFAFMDAMPQSQGHALVIPKRHTPDIFGLEPLLLHRLVDASRRLAQAAKTAFTADGIMLAQLNGAAAGQTVFHVHFHVIPRYEGTALKMHAREWADKNDLADQAAKIASALAQAAG
jgi:histidine triad (HIT) family protein